MEDNRGWGQRTAPVREGREEGRREDGEIIEGLGGHGQGLGLTVNTEFTRLPFPSAEGSSCQASQGTSPSPPPAPLTGTSGRDRPTYSLW